MVNGAYVYNQANAGKAHSACLRGFTAIIADTEPCNVVIVDNTNTTALELSPYVRVCEAFEREYEIVFLRCSFEDSLARNVHGVPSDTIYRMYQNLNTERIPWPQTIMLESK